jgi:hypothetical protein
MKKLLLGFLFFAIAACIANGQIFEKENLYNVQGSSHISLVYSALNDFVRLSYSYPTTMEGKDYKGYYYIDIKYPVRKYYGVKEISLSIDNEKPLSLDTRHMVDVSSNIYKNYGINIDDKIIDHLIDSGSFSIKIAFFKNDTVETFTITKDQIATGLQRLRDIGRALNSY